MVDIEANDKTEFQLNGYLWQKVQFYIQFYIKGGARDLCDHFASMLAPPCVHFSSFNFQGFFSGYQTRLFEKWANEIYEKGDNLVKVR